VVTDIRGPPHLSFTTSPTLNVIKNPQKIGGPRCRKRLDLFADKWIFGQDAHEIRERERQCLSILLHAPFHNAARKVLDRQPFLILGRRAIAIRQQLILQFQSGSTLHVGVRTSNNEHKVRHWVARDRVMDDQFRAAVLVLDQIVKRGKIMRHSNSPAAPAAAR
jgi:hypothetical protein